MTTLHLIAYFMIAGPLPLYRGPLPLYRGPLPLYQGPLPLYQGAFWLTQKVKIHLVDQILAILPGVRV